MNTNQTGITTILKQAGRRIKLSAILVGVSWWLVTCLGIWLALFLLDNFLRLPAGLRLPLAVGGALLVGFGFVKKIYRVAAEKQRVERTAILLEKRYGVPDNALINACQFETRSFRPEERQFAERTFNLGVEHAGAIRISDLWNKRDMLRWGSGAILLIVAWVVYASLYPRYVLNAGARFVSPLSDRPPVASLQLNINPGTDLTVVEGENVEITAEVAGKALNGTPTLVWKEAVTAVEPDPASGENLVMAGAPGLTSRYTYTFADVRRQFAFRVFADDAYSRSVRVLVKTLPRIKESFFCVTPPAYIGMGAVTNPGPPTSVGALPGSKLELIMMIEPSVSAANWLLGSNATACKNMGRHWQMETIVTAGGEYDVEVTAPGLRKNVSLTKGALRLETDQPPQIEFITTDRNRLVNLGTTVPLEIQASDDYGVRAIEITVRTPESEQVQRVAKSWTYIGPPGNKGPFKESYKLEVDPQFFKPDTAYLLEALAIDFRPNAQPSKSRPIMLRVKSLDNFAPASDDPLASGFASLRSTITFQDRSLNRTANLKTYLEEAIKNKSIKDRAREISTHQSDARRNGQMAIKYFNNAPDGKVYAATMEPLVNGEMPWALRDVEKLPALAETKLTAEIADIEKRQTYILSELIALLGKIADQKQQLARTNSTPKDNENTPMVKPEDIAKELTDDLKKFMAAQEKILERSKALMDKRPEDLTDKEDKILGDMAREEGEWSKFLQEKLTDFSKLPQQDFSDGKLSKEVNEVYQEIKMASSNLFGKKVELAVPAEQSGLEGASNLVQNLEKWLPDKPDNIKWNMEEATGAPADVPMAELPSELEDIVGDLIDKEEEMTQDIEDVSSPWMDSLDKGAGWGAGDGPISSMSAKGVTGNTLPNQMEIGGRSGEGRTGRSSGQMVEETAQGKGGRETPTRLDATPFEEGAVKDEDKNSKGGATGGGKLSGHGAEGLRGPNSPQLGQKMPRIADNQAKIRQEAESLALALRKYKLPTGDLEASINAMKKVEQAARKGDGLGVRRAFSQAVNMLGDAKRTVRVESGLHRERTKLPESYRDEIKTGLSDGIPKGYEEMVGEYFKVLADQNTGNKK
ncbi:MAG: hypothetical protein WCO56_19140 [Verrucomicrobiota bacterium]